MNKTGIEYLDYSYNPIIMRCTPTSPACKFCWHLGAADRLKNNPTVPEEYRLIYSGGHAPHLATERLLDPFRVKSPKFVGVQFMGDLFHPAIINDFRDMIFESMEKAPWHRYLLLTKRPEVMLHYQARRKSAFPPYVWVGVTAENQELFDKRMKFLSQINASVSFVSIEPMLEEIDITPYAQTLNWVIAGCESGGVKTRRPTDWEWVMSLRDQCVDNGIPFFLKQMEGGPDDAARIVKMPFLGGGIWNQRPPEQRGR